MKKDGQDPNLQYACGSTRKKLCTRPGTRRTSEVTHNVLYALRKQIGSVLAFEDHKWGSSRTIIQQEEEISSMALDFKIDVPYVVQW